MLLLFCYFIPNLCIMNSTASPQNLDLLLVNSPLKRYGEQERKNNFTLPTLGLAYIATYAESRGFSVEVLDAEARALSIAEVTNYANTRHPRWAGLNLLAPTYRHSTAILRGLSPDIQIMLGGHQAKAMPAEIMNDTAIPRIDALILGEAETRVARLLEDTGERERLPQVYWRENGGTGSGAGDNSWLFPDINDLPFVDRKFLVQDPYIDGGVVESAMIASRGCPFRCSFCGAVDPAHLIRMRSPDNILAEMRQLRDTLAVRRIRFLDDLFLASPKAMRAVFTAFSEAKTQLQWDANGRANIIANASGDLINSMRDAGAREIALGIETGSDRLLKHIGKNITVAQAEAAIVKLCRAGIDVKGFFILGMPTETRKEQNKTESFIEHLWATTEALPGVFRCSVFAYRPYPGTIDWQRLLAAGFSKEELLTYTQGEADEAIPERDEFDFSTGLQFGEVPAPEVRQAVTRIMKRQKEFRPR